MKAALILAAAASIAACSQQENPGGVTDEENEGLTEAARMLDSAEELPGEAELGNAETGDAPAAAAE